MATQDSAGLLVYRRARQGVEFFLAHPGGPYWARRDAGAWTIPKGGIGPGEDPLEAARREFQEETGFVVPGPFRPLTTIRQPGGKRVRAWLAAADFDPAGLRSITFEMEWPPRSGRLQAFPEVDRGGWFALPAALEKILPGQAPLLREAAALLAEDV